MDLDLIRIEPNSNPKEEFLVFESYGNTSLSDFILLVKVKGNDVLQPTFNLPNARLSSNDRIFLYSGIGENSAKNNDKKAQDFCHYLNSHEQIWKRSIYEKLYLFDKNKSSVIDIK